MKFNQTCMLYKENGKNTYKRIRKKFTTKI